MRREPPSGSHRGLRRETGDTVSDAQCCLSALGPAPTAPRQVIPRGKNTRETGDQRTRSHTVPAPGTQGPGGKEMEAKVSSSFPRAGLSCSRCEVPRRVYSSDLS